MLKLKTMHNVKIILLCILLISILTMGLLYSCVYMIQQENNKEVSELINYFEDVLMLKVASKETKDTPFEYYNDVDNYPFTKKASADVKYNVRLNGTSGEIRLKYTQNIYSDENEERHIIHSAHRCPAIWMIEKKNNKWEVVKIAEHDYQYRMSHSEYIDALKILNKMDAER